MLQGRPRQTSHWRQSVPRGRLLPAPPLLPPRVGLPVRPGGALPPPRLLGGQTSLIHCDGSSTTSSEVNGVWLSSRYGPSSSSCSCAGPTAVSGWLQRQRPRRLLFTSSSTPSYNTDHQPFHSPLSTLPNLSESPQDVTLDPSPPLSPCSSWQHSPEQCCRRQRRCDSLSSPWSSSSGQHRHHYRRRRFGSPSSSWYRPPGQHQSHRPRHPRTLICSSSWT